MSSPSATHDRIAEAERRLETLLEHAVEYQFESIAEEAREALAALRGTNDPVDPRREALISKAHKFERQHGRPPTARDWKTVTGTEWPSYQTAIRHFGSWDHFILECGWKPRGRGRPTQ